MTVLRFVVAGALALSLLAICTPSGTTEGDARAAAYLRISPPYALLPPTHDVAALTRGILRSNDMEAADGAAAAIARGPDGSDVEVSVFSPQPEHANGKFADDFARAARARPRSEEIRIGAQTLWVLSGDSLGAVWVDRSFVIMISGSSRQQVIDAARAIVLAHE